MAAKWNWSLVFGFILCAQSSLAGGPPGLQPLHFLLGRWAATGSGKPGDASGNAVFSGEAQGHVMLRKSFADYPAINGRPAFRHDDFMVIYVDADSLVKADFYDSEGHVIRYVVTVKGPGNVEFLSVATPAVPRFRLTYVLSSEGALGGQFDIAPPGTPDVFTQYLRWTSRKTSD
jgi:hypothetical protein